MKMNKYFILFYLILYSLYCDGQNLKAIRISHKDKKANIVFYYRGNDSNSVATTYSLRLYTDKSFLYQYKSPFMEDTLFNSGIWQIQNDTLILYNSLTMDKLPIEIEYTDISMDNNYRRKIGILKDLNGTQYIHAMVWINNLKMGCMGGMAVCCTGPGFETIDSIRVHIGKDIFSDWIDIEQNDKDILLTILTTTDLTKTVFLNDKIFIKKRRTLKEIKN